ncbi:MAG: hypothetical protein KC505_04630 [Myxococcales bacterium]|nr:hypothetical protein [Myxococcales bacterium]USN51616.1 MAG: hypothetical protein H6731_04185 [Myxococcales bacterium]
MNSIGILFFTFVSISTLDIFAGQLQRYNRETSYFKSAGLYPLLLLALEKRNYIIDKITSIKRFFIALFSFVILLSASAILLKKGFSHQKNLAVIMLGLAPVMAMPFYHFLFGILGTNPIKLNATVKNFRLRGILAVTISANIIFLYLSYEKTITNHIVHLFFSLSALCYVFFLLSKTRAKKTYNNNFDEEQGSGPVGFIHYLTNLMEFFYYSVLIFFVFLQSLASTVLSEQPLIFAVPISLGILYLFTIVVVKFLFVERTPPSLNFYEAIILPLSFSYFSIVFIYQSVF